LKRENIQRVGTTMLLSLSVANFGVEICYDLAKQLSQYLYFFSLLLVFKDQTYILLFSLVYWELANIFHPIVRTAINYSLEPTTACLDNTAINIKQDCPPIRTNDKDSCSISFSPIDDAFTSFKDNYIEQVAAQNNMDMEVSHTSLLLDMPLYNFTLSFF